MLPTMQSDYALCQQKVAKVSIACMCEKIKIFYVNLEKYTVWHYLVWQLGKMFVSTKQKNNR